MHVGKRVAAAALGLTFVFGVSTASGQKMYVTELGGVVRANLDGSEVENLVFGDAAGGAIALDLEDEKLYWTEPNNERIRRANLDGSDVEEVLTGVESFGIALDVASDKMYFTNSGAIQRANLDGSVIEDVVATEFALALALDLPNGKIYWTEVIRKIKRANLDGTQIEDVISDVQTFPVDIALDLTHGKVYWAMNDLAFGEGGSIQRANLDGAEVQDVIPPLTISWGIALDVPGNSIYFTLLIKGTIQRANLDGSDLQDLVTGLDNPFRIALDLRRPVPIPMLPERGLIMMGVLLLAAGIVVFRARSRRVEEHQVIDG